MQLQEEQQLNIEQRQADRERIARLENTLFDVVIKSEEEKSARLTPGPKSNRVDLQKFRIAGGPSTTLSRFSNGPPSFNFFFPPRASPTTTIRSVSPGDYLKTPGYLTFMSRKVRRTSGKRGTNSKPVSLRSRSPNAGETHYGPNSANSQWGRRRPSSPSAVVHELFKRSSTLTSP
ncbi:hypothetical protein PSTG_18931, partial [Puccinia striiformis f. sp. tritici PST-78]